MADQDDFVAMKVDVGILKTQVSGLTALCDKMDTVLDKLIENHDRMVNQIYDDMEKRKTSTNMDIKELHSRISTISREMSDKVELTERRIMEEIKNLRNDISEHNKMEDKELKKLLEWRWMAAGAIVVVAWLLSNIKLDTLGKLLN
jgi:deoxyadenosine/deoxycytidine kinase